ncbi:MAG: cytochrome P450 [Sneathiellaceae bacterium]
MESGRETASAPAQAPRIATGDGGAPDDDRALADDFDLLALPDSFYDDPYPTYRALRRHAPVKPIAGGVLLTRHADVLRVYKDTALFRSDKKAEFGPKFGDSPLYRHHTTSLVFNDPPLHTRVRRLIMGALSPRVVADMEPALVALVDRLLDRLAARAGPVDLVADFAAAIPVEIIGNLLGVPHDEREPLRDWSLAILGALEPSISPAQFDRGNAAVTAFLAYLEGLVAARRARPGDPERDVLTRLIRGEGDGERLSQEELLQQCIFILNAGHETTTNLIGNALVLLCDWPEERRRLLAEPGLIRTAVEEFLRFESSNQLGNRGTAAATEVGGVALPAGTGVTLCIGAANRDPEVFADPDRLDLGRQPNRHLAFGGGPHQCAGLAVARLEGIVAIGRFLARFPEFRLTERPRRNRRARFRGFGAIGATLA